MPLRLNDDRPMSIITIYIPIKKYPHWNIKFPKPLTLGLIENQPDMNTNTFTQTIDMDSIKILVAEGIKFLWTSRTVGSPRLQKSA